MAGSALVFAGDTPDSWWVVHSGRPRFAGRLLRIDEFNAEPRWAAIVPHGLSAALPVHFNLGSDVLVITDFIDPVTVAEGESPQQAILTQPMLDALHACTRAIARIARRDPAFARLAEHAEQFLVGWRLLEAAEGEVDLLHASGAQVIVRADRDGDLSAELLQPPGEEVGGGWAPELLYDHLQRVAGERALRLLATGYDRVTTPDGTLTLDAFEQAARASPRRLHWSAVERDGVRYAALELLHGDGLLRYASEVEIDAAAALDSTPRALDDADAEAVLALAPMYGLHGALNLVAADRFGWPVNVFERGTNTPHDAPPLPYLPCEVELLAEGEIHPAVAFAPPDADGLYRLVIAPHSAPTERSATDGSQLLPFECVQVERARFHVPAYLVDGDSLV